MTPAVQSHALNRQHNVIFIPDPLRVCGNCRYWVGPRVRNSGFGYETFSHVMGSCYNRTRELEIPQELLDDATPLANPDCPIWRKVLYHSFGAAS